MHEQTKTQTEDWEQEKTYALENQAQDQLTVFSFRSLSPSRELSCQASGGALSVRPDR